MMSKQATTDTTSAPQLVYNADGYYTYTFKTDFTNQAHALIP